MEAETTTTTAAAAPDDGAADRAAIRARAETMQARVMMLQVRRFRAGLSKKARAQEVSPDAAQETVATALNHAAGAVLTNAKPGRVSASKRILEGDALKAVSRVYDAMDEYLEARKLPSPFKGVYSIPLSIFETVDDALNGFVARLNEALEAVRPAYDDMVAAAEADLGNLFDPRDYKGIDSFIKAHRIEWQWITFDTPERLQTLRRDMWERERNKMQGQLASAFGDIRDALRTGFAAMIREFHDRLRPGEDGKRRRLTPAALNNLRDFVGLFDVRNITDDAELGAVVKTAQDLLDGVELDALRTDDDLRATMADALDAVRAQADKLAVSVDRAVRFDDGDAV